MAFTRDWLEANPIDRSKFKETPGAVRATKVDVSDRLKDILSGFVSGETAWGIKLGKYLTQGTGAPAAPTGTGTAIDMNMYIRTNGTGVYPDMYIRGTSGSETRITFESAPLFITGEIKMYGGSTAPTGWLLCNGASVLNASYPALFAVLSTRYGSVDGTHFNLPDFTDRVPRGVATTPGTGGGANEVTLLVANLAAHSHDIDGYDTTNDNGVSVSSSAAEGGVKACTTKSQGTGTPFSIVPSNTQVVFIIKT